MFLQEVKSDLFDESTQIPFDKLCRQLNIAKGPEEDLRPVNTGLLFFSNNPEAFFNRAWIEVVLRKDEAGNDYSEKYFKGPIHNQLRDTLNFIKTHIIVENVKKIAGQAEAERFFNYPYEAVEEALANAVYHKSYELDKPIEVQIWPDRIEILSFPGPVPPVNAEILASNRRIVARDYRNRRIGDFLKELHLTEGRGTGVPKIYGALERNGSPKPILETDANSTYFLTVLYSHLDAVLLSKNDQESYETSSVINKQNISTLNDLNILLDTLGDQVSDQVSNQVSNQVKILIETELGDKAKSILEYIKAAPRKSNEILEELLGITSQTKNKQKYINSLLDQKWIEITIKDNPKDRNQKYRLTEKGSLLLKLLK
jgi:ATP-dependent DNA helicase RecG